LQERNYIAIRNSQINYYRDVGLYYIEGGSFVLYKPPGKLMAEIRLSEKMHPAALYIHQNDRINAIKELQKDVRSEIRTLINPDPANAEKYRDRYGLKCTIETDASKMLQQNDIDIVVVCTPHNIHTQDVIAAAEAQKHISIEKRVAITPTDLGFEPNRIRISLRLTLSTHPRPVSITFAFWRQDRPDPSRQIGFDWVRL